MSIITIVGASGQVGSKIVNNLSGKGHQLRLIARSANKLQQVAGNKDMSINAGDSLDSNFLAGVIKGSDAVLLMMPTGMQTENVDALQNQLGLAQIDAIKISGVKKVLFISSVGGHTEDHTGIVAGLARQEVRLKALNDVDVLILRPSYFLENLLANIGLIKSAGINGSALEGNKAFPLIASQDVARVAAEKLNDLNWTGKIVQPLLGARDYSMNEITKVLGQAIGKPDLQYVQFPYEQAKQAMLQWGLSDSIAQAYIGLSEGINLGYFNTEARDAKSTTPTTVEEFAKVFAHVYSAS